MSSFPQQFHQTLHIRTAIRHLVIDALSAEETPFGPGEDDCGFADWMSPDEDECNVYDSHHDPIQAFCSFDDDGNVIEKDLPAVVIYTQNNSWEPLDWKTPTACFPANINLDIEIYACGESGWELEALLDDLERQVLFKLFLDKPFRKAIEEITDMQSNPHRDSQLGGRYGMRRLSMGLRLRENFTPALKPDNPLCAKFTFKVGDDPETPMVTTGDIYDHDNN